MTRAMYRGVFVEIGERQTKAVFPVISVAQENLVLNDKGKPDPAKSLLLVKGAIQRANPALGGQVQFLDLDGRWCHLRGDEVAQLLATADKDGTIHSIWMFSSIAGNSAGPGSEPAYLVELTGSEAAVALADKYGVAYEVTHAVGRAQIPVTHRNAVIVSAKAAQAVGFGLYAPPVEKEQPRGSRLEENPHLLQALAHFDATGQLPDRVATPVNYNAEIAGMFAQPQAAQAPRGRGQRRSGQFW